KWGLLAVHTRLAWPKRNGLSPRIAEPMTWYLYFLAVPFVFGYLLGSIPFGLILTSAAGLGDIRKQGSGNIGATNVLRTGNKTLAAATLLLDAAKGAVAVAIFLYLGPP